MIVFLDGQGADYTLKYDVEGAERRLLKDQAKP